MSKSDDIFGFAGLRDPSTMTLEERVANLERWVDSLIDGAERRDMAWVELRDRVDELLDRAGELARHRDMLVDTRKQLEQVRNLLELQRRRDDDEQS